MKRINFNKLKREERAANRTYSLYGEKVFLDALKQQARDYNNFDPEIMERAYLRFYEKVFIDSAKRGIAITRQVNKKLLSQAFFLTTWRNWIGTYIATDILIQGLIKNVNERTLKEIGIALGQAVEMGLDTDRITDSIVEFVASRSRAKGIAVTETTRATAEGKKRAGEIWGQETGLAMWKIWIHSGNPNEPRENHLELDQVAVRTEERFSNGLDKPGDASGPASETIRCGCTIVYVDQDYIERYYPDLLNS